MDNNKYQYKIHDKFYDLTDFVKIHPGGKKIFDNLESNLNITPMVYSYHKNPKKILEILPKYEIPLNNSIIKYDTDYTYDKYCELKKLVCDEMIEKNIPFYWSNNEIAYNAFMFLSYLGLWTYCFKNAANLSYLWILLLSIYTTGWGILVFHETSHHTGFKNQKYNLLYSENFPFIDTSYWKIQHNYLHHSFTDTEYDCDLLLEVSDYIRYTNLTKPNNAVKFQHIYMVFIWLLGGIVAQSKTYFSIAQSNKYLLIPMIYFLGIDKVLLFYSLFVAHFLFIANLSHIQYECIQINTENKNDFLYNQISSSINYETNNPLVRFIAFGLDIQIEHHLFPNIPHSSLRKIKHVVKNYCVKNNVPYIENLNIFQSIWSYFKYIFTMGNC